MREIQVFGNLGRRSSFVQGVEVEPGSAFAEELFALARRVVDPEPQDRFVVAGKAVSCAHCAHDRFVEGRALLNTAGMSFLNLDWANRSAATLTCTACGRIEWFLADPEEA